MNYNLEFLTKKISEAIDFIIKYLNDIETISKYDF